VVVPARSEGEAVKPTLASIDAAAEGHHVTTVLLLDGPDQEAAEAVRQTAAIPIVKMPPGPSKGVALRWLVESHRDLFDNVDAVLILDVGSRLVSGFFDHMVLPLGTQATQAWLRGTHGGVGDAASLSESAAQRWQDRGRQVLGWAAQLRGTGVVYTPSALRSVAPRLRTAVEDTEATLLLAADGASIVLGSEGAIVEDVKPTTIEDAARQRSRWLLGQIAIFVRQPGAICRLLARKPAEGIAFVSALLSRPLSLTALLRLTFALAFLLDGLLGAGGALSLAASAVLVSSLTCDFFLLRRATGVPFSRLTIDGARMLASWCWAILLLPLAVAGWVRSRRD
jgi:cellulose synthase/poly-beta-1,6-N-acetylglucosamine synthase-like glycosyltransferase